MVTIQGLHIPETLSKWLRAELAVYLRKKLGTQIPKCACICRFPFDEQNCSIELVFPEFNEEDVIWKLNGWVTTDSAHLTINPSWTFIRNYSEVINYRITKRIGDREINESKSVFKHTVVLKRHPRTTIVYVILPTMAIALFNLISLLLPTGEGMYQRFLSPQQLA